MDKDELMKIAHSAIVDADEESAVKVIEDAIAEGIDIIEILKDGFGKGNREVGDLFEAGKLSLPELIFCTEVMRKVLDIVENFPGVDKEEAKGKVLIATVEGDVHEIGKGIVASTLKSYGFEVIDIGREVAVDTIIEKAKEYDVDIIATSALLTSTLKEQKKLEDALKQMGLKNRFKTMVGGAPCTLRWAKRIGADAYSEDAIEAVKKALELLQK